MISFCEKNNQDLTVLWLNSEELGCDFDDIFNPIRSEKIQITIVQDLSVEEFLKKYNIRDRNIIKNRHWSKLYNSKRHIKNGLSLDESDEIFYSTIYKQMNSIVFNSSENFLLETCYRHHGKNSDSYKNFQPVDSILDRITQKVEEFNQTIGVHVRRTDHFRAIEVSSDSKVLIQINKILNEKPETTFFLSTDCNSTKEKLKAQFGKSILVNQGLTYDRNNSNSIQHAVLDLYCLSKTELIYGSFFSTYSQVAADISGIENIIIK